MCDSNTFKDEAASFLWALLAGRWAVKGWRKADLTEGVKFSLCPPFPAQSPAQVEQSTEESSVLHARAGH